ncbi:unnamed protein product [Peniophora sp. CBMAI 1063]|nr:unnamed protein product [Peniophora sp. CBMAI 1063]
MVSPPGTSGLRLVVLSLWVMTLTVRALQVPSTWLDTTSNLSRESRENLALNAATAIGVDAIDPSSGLSQSIPTTQYMANLFAGLALQDYNRANNTWTKPVTQLMQDYYRKQGVYDAPGSTGLVEDGNFWALAFYYAYRTYRQEFLLETAIEIYNHTRATAFVTLDAAASGSGAGRNVSFVQTANCSDWTFAGGVFASNAVQNNTNVCAKCVGPFLALSAYLFEATNETVYSEAAQLSVDFMIHHLWNGTIVYDMFNLNTCTPHPNPLTVNQAGFIEGLAVWANVTKNATLTSLLEEVVSSTTTFPVWSLSGSPVISGEHTLNRFVRSTSHESTESGALKNWAPNLKGLFIRGLAEARMRNPGSVIARYVEAYVTIQFNALIDNAQGAAPDDSWYSPQWAGPRASSYNSAGNIAALDVLNTALTFVSPESSGSSDDPVSTDSHGSSTPTGAVAGGVIGGIAAIAIAVIFTMRHQRRKRATTHSTDVLVTPNEDRSDGILELSSVDPFVHTAPAAQTRNKWQGETVYGYVPPDRDRAQVSPEATESDLGRQEELPPAYEVRNA